MQDNHENPFIEGSTLILVENGNIIFEGKIMIEKNSENKSRIAHHFS